MGFHVLNLFLGIFIFIKCEYVIDIDEEPTTMMPPKTDKPDLSIVPPVYSDEITYYHYTSKFFDQRYRLLIPNKTDTFSNLAGKIYFFIHGYRETRKNTKWYRPITELIIKKYPYANVVIVDWRKPAGYYYNISVITTQKAAAMMGNMISKIYLSNDKPKETILVGNSVGGQVAGLVAKIFKKKTGKKVSRIISLDPAGYPYNTSSVDKRLVADDAENVVVVHTDEIVGIGNVAIGTLDFFVNGGISQPGCPPVPPYNVSIRTPGPTEPFWCNHIRVNNYFVEAVKSPEHFLARKCKEYASFKAGNCEDILTSLGDLETTRRGSFFLDTTGEPPYYKRKIDLVQFAKKPSRT